MCLLLSFLCRDKLILCPSYNSRFFHHTLSCFYIHISKDSPNFILGARIQYQLPSSRVIRFDSRSLSLFLSFSNLCLKKAFFSWCIIPSFTTSKKIYLLSDASSREKIIGLTSGE